MDTYNEIVALADQAARALARQKYQAAINGYIRALKLAKALFEETGLHSQLLAVLCNRIGKVHMAQGKVQQAVYFFEGALLSLERGRHPDLNAPQLALDIPRPLNISRERRRRPSKGFSRLSNDNFYQPVEQPPPIYTPQAAAELSTEEADPALAIRLRINVGNAYLHQPQEGPALTAYQAVLNDEHIEAHPLLKAYAIMYIGEIYRRRQQLDKAEVNLAEAVELLDFHLDPPDPLEKRHAVAISASIAKDRAVAISANIAKDRQEIDRAVQLYQQALALYQQAADLHQQAADLFGQGRTEIGVAFVYSQQVQFNLAKEHYQKALELAERANDQDTQWCAYEGIGRCLFQAGQLQESIEAFEKSLRLIEQRQEELQTDEGKVTFFDSVKDIFDQLLRAHLDWVPQAGHGYGQALAVAERARGQSLQDLMAGNNRRHQVPPELLNVFRDHAPDNPFDPEHPEWRQAPLDVRQRAPAVHVPPQSHRNRPDAPVEREPLARLVFYVLPDRTAVFVIQPDGGVEGHVAPISYAEMKERVANLREQIIVEQSSDWNGHDAGLNLGWFRLESALQAFYTDLIAPVAAALPPQGQLLVIEPHASLWLMPFAALQTSDGQWMSDQWPLLYAASHQTLQEIRQTPRYATLAESKILIVGNPTMPQPPEADKPLSSLPGSLEEAEAIAQLLTDYQHKLLQGSEATETMVTALAREHNILHLATHGIAYAEDPLDSFVALAPIQDESSSGEKDDSGKDGLLTAREISTNGALPLDLAVLSACETGLGKISGDGMLGLSRALLIAGARSIIVSQWRVADNATVGLMRAFYKHYIDSGQPVLALQQAMRQMRKDSSGEHNYPHPRYWSPFLVIGAER
ncbi:MAG: CHAT domain-containing protein [Cyanobacteria bacterium P01_F01_bin.3]